MRPLTFVLCIGYVHYMIRTYMIRTYLSHKREVVVVEQDREREREREREIKLKSLNGDEECEATTNTRSHCCSLLRYVCMYA